MGALLIRTAYSTNIKERHDARPRSSIARRLSRRRSTFRYIWGDAVGDTPCAKRYPASDMRPGDAFIANDAYNGGGTHLADVTIASPVFHEGKLIAFVANMGHWPDVGGIKPGAAMTEGCTEIYQEGLRIPPMRVMREGVLQENLFSFILLNMRFAEDRPADLYVSRRTRHGAASRKSAPATRRAFRH
jgi:N-methylhydantoinase B